MLAPLDERILRSLIVYDEEVENEAHCDPRRPFAANWVSAGLHAIFWRFHFLFRAVLDSPGGIRGAEWPDPPYWAIEFRERPWKHLSIRPDPDDKTSCRVFEDEKHVKTYKMLGCPDQWVELVRWVWNYGNERAMALEAMDARRKARKNANNPALSLPTRRSRSRSKPMPPPPSNIHPASHVLRLTRLRPHQGFKRRGGKQRPSLLSTMTLAGIEEDADVEAQVSEEAAPTDCAVLRESSANRQGTLRDTPKGSTAEIVKLGFSCTQDAPEDEVG